MYADPQILAILGTATSLTRRGTAQPERLGTFRDPEGTISFDVRQNSTNNRFRREVRLTRKKVAADPFTAINKEVSASVMIVVDEPRNGFTDAELGDLTNSIINWFSDQNRDKLLGGEL